MSLRGLSGRRARRTWSIAAACAALAEYMAWQGSSVAPKPWVWLLLGLCSLSAVWFWRESRLASHSRRDAGVDEREPGAGDSINPSVDPALAAIREIWMQEGVPRIVVNAKHEGVRVPAHVRDRWGHQLVIDLDPRYPLRLEVTFEGCAVDLSFSGEVSRCIFAWPSIYTVQNRGSGAAVVIEARIPKDVATPS